MTDCRHEMSQPLASDSYEVGGRSIAHPRSVRSRKLAFAAMLQNEFLVVVHRKIHATTMTVAAAAITLQKRIARLRSASVSICTLSLRASYMNRLRVGIFMIDLSD
jgi:hypothetical protein